MTKLELLKAEQMELTQNIGWTESHLEGITEEEKELYIYELNELEIVTKQIAQVTEWEQLGYHENKIVGLFDAMYPVVTEEVETITVHHLGKNVEKVLQVGNNKLIISTFFKNQLEKSYEIKNKSKHQIYEYLKKSWFMSEYEINNVILKMGCKINNC